METKHTNEHAEIMAEQHLADTFGKYYYLQQDGWKKLFVNMKSAYIAGYIKAIQQTAAPELLEQLNKIITAIEDGSINRDHIEYSKELIKKATE